MFRLEANRMSKLKFFFRESWLLLAASVAFGALLALTEAAWRPRIEQNEIDKFSNLARLLLPDAAQFESFSEPIQLSKDSEEPVNIDVRKAINASGKTVGWVFVVEGSGFSDVIRLVVAVDAQFKSITGFRVLLSSETPGFGDKITIADGYYQSQYKGAPADLFSLRKVGDSKIIDDEIIAITGATVTSQAVVDIMNAHVIPIKEQLSKKGLLP